MPSCRRQNYPKRFDGFDFLDEDESDSEDEKSARTNKVDPMHGIGAASGAKIMANSLATDGKLFWILNFMFRASWHSPCHHPQIRYSVRANFSDQRRRLCAASGGKSGKHFFTIRVFLIAFCGRHMKAQILLIFSAHSNH